MKEMQPIGVISIGSNDIHLLVARSDGVQTFERVGGQSVLAELVGSVKGGVIPTAALMQALQDLEGLVRVARKAGANTIIAIATEAMREVANGPQFLNLVSSTLGIQAVLISGQEEAGLDYCWAAFPVKPVPDLPVMVVDSGGGSTQIVFGAGKTPAFATSLPVGAGNMTARFITQSPLAKHELKALEDYLALQTATLPITFTSKSVVLLGGSADNLLKFTDKPEHDILTRDDLEKALHHLQRREAADVAREFGIPVERARLLGAGAVILNTVLTHYNVDAAYVKANGIRGGLVVSYARDRENWRQGLVAESTSHRAE